MKVRELIDKHNKSYSSYYMGELYTHTPMALVALKDLGARDDRLDEFYKLDVKKLEPIKKPVLEINSSNWKDFLGKYEYEASYINFFQDNVKKDGIETTLKKFFDVLMRGVGAAAFHPIIRLSYAVKEENKDEVVISLATWASSYLDLKVDSLLVGDKSLLDVIETLKKENFGQSKKLEGLTIVERMYNASSLNGYKEQVQKISEMSSQRNELEKTLLWLFSQSNNFTLLHGVTSHHAFESLISLSSEEKSSRGYFVKAILAAYLSTTGVFQVDLSWDYPSSERLPNWKELKEKAVSSNDDHVIKLIHTLSLKGDFISDQELRFAASLKLGLIA